MKRQTQTLRRNAIPFSILALLLATLVLSSSARADIILAVADPAHHGLVALDESTYNFAPATDNPARVSGSQGQTRSSMSQNGAMIALGLQVGAGGFSSTGVGPQSPFFGPIPIQILGTNNEAEGTPVTLQLQSNTGGGSQAGAQTQLMLNNKIYTPGQVYVIPGLKIGDTLSYFVSLNGAFTKTSANFLSTLSVQAAGFESTLPGNVLIVDLGAGTSTGRFERGGALFGVEAQSGARTLLNDFGVGPNPGVQPRGVAVDAHGQILVVDRDAGPNLQGALFRIDPQSGARTLLNDFGVGANPGINPTGVAVEADGQILVVDPDAGGVRGMLFRIDPESGARTVLSDFGRVPKLGIDPTGVAVEPSGQILVIDPRGGFQDHGQLFRIDPQTGARTLLSEFGVGPNPGRNPVGVAVEADGQILVIDHDGPTLQGMLFRVDPISGMRTVLSDFGVGLNLGVDPSGVAIEASGQILVVDPLAGTGGLGALFRIDPVSGLRSAVSDFGFGAPPGFDPIGLAIVPDLLAGQPPRAGSSVVVDIKPGRARNSINLKNRRTIPVAILTTDSFDATTVDPLSLKFGPGGASNIHGGQGHLVDANGDGELDLLLRFSIREAGIRCGDTSASLKGKTLSGQAIQGTDVIRTVACCNDDEDDDDHDDAI